MPQQSPAGQRPTNAGPSPEPAAGTILSAGAPAETILRIRGEFMLHLPGTLEPGGQLLVSAGMVLVPEGQGTTVAWNPFDDPNAPWIWFSEYTLGYTEYVANVIDSPVFTAVRAVIDNKAMRKAGPTV